MYIPDTLYIIKDHIYIIFVYNIQENRKTGQQENRKTR